MIPAPNERAACYSCYGLDGSRMADYYDHVTALESALAAAPAAARPAGAAQRDGCASVTASMAE
jgi:hypothetical protein